MKTPRHFIPTLQEIRTLEAVARLGSISAAADELNVSQPTASYHIKQLEDRWGAKLFRKKGRSLESTELVHDIFNQISTVTANIDSLSAHLSQHTQQKPFCVGVATSFASLVLVSRLEQFCACYPDINIRVNATNRYVDFTKENIDVALRLLPRLENSSAIADDNILIPVPNERLRVVCSPAYFDQLIVEHSTDGLWDISLLRHARYIHEEDSFHWQKYFSHHFPQVTEYETRSLSFNNADLIHRSAIAGRGMAILRDLYIQEAIREGTLIEPFTPSIPCDRLFQFVLPEHKMPSKQAWHFIQWLSGQMRDIVNSP